MDRVAGAGTHLIPRSRQRILAERGAVLSTPYMR